MKGKIGMLELKNGDVIMNLQLLLGFLTEK